MKRELEQELRKIAPNFLIELDAIYCGDGWAPLLKNLFKIIEYHITDQIPNELKGQIKAVQIKEKFGALRVYSSNSTPFMDGAVTLAESLSDSVCELCGNLGSRRTLNCIQTLCESCYEIKLGLKQ